MPTKVRLVKAMVFPVVMYGCERPTQTVDVLLIPLYNGRKQRGTKEPLDEGESEKVGLKLNIQKTNIMASGPIASWEIDGETVSDFIFLGSEITADGDCSHEIKRSLLLGRKVMTNLDSILKSRDITLPAIVRLVKAMVFQWSCKDARIGL